MSSYQIEHHMLRWRRWNQVGTGKPKEPVCLVGKMIKAPPDADDYEPLTDDEAEEVNEALLKLKEKLPEAHKAILVRYVDSKFTPAEAGKALGFSEAKIKVLWREGRAYLDAKLL